MKKVTVGKSKGIADAEQCDIHVVRHLLTVLKCGYEFDNKEILFNDCDEMAKFVGFKDFKDLQEKVNTPKVFEIIVNCA